MLFNGPDTGKQPPKLPLYIWDPDFHLIRGSLSPQESDPNVISIYSAVFAGHKNIINRQTDTQT